MATKKSYKCTTCGHIYSKWNAECNECGEIGTLEEIDSAALQINTTKPGSRADRASTGDTPELVKDIQTTEYKRLSSGVEEFDRVLGGGFVPGGIILLAGSPGVGKALSLDTKLVTPDGWITMGEVKVGDFVIDHKGEPTKIIAVSEVWQNRPTYEVEFSDGSIIVADENHEWLTKTRKERTTNQLGKVRTTKEIYNTQLVDSDNRINHSVPVSQPILFKEQELPIPPYTFGAWLGDGTSAGNGFTNVDTQIIENIEVENVVVKKLKTDIQYSLSFNKIKYDEQVDICLICEKKLSFVRNRKTNYCISHRDVNTFTKIFRDLNVLNNKHIPMIYLRSSIEQRRNLLAGLLDTDGYITKKGCIQLALTSKSLANDAYELIVSLGYKPSRTTKVVKGRNEDSSLCYITSFSPVDDLFKLNRKSSRITSFERKTQKQRYIKSVTLIDSVPTKCIEVDNEEHMFLAGESMIPTHNSSITSLIGSSLSARGKKVLIVSGEETKAQIKSRLDRIHANTDSLYLLAESNLSNVKNHVMMVLPDVLIIDSVQTLTSSDSDGRVGSITQVTEVAQEITQLGKRLNIPTIMIGHVTKDGNIAGPRVVEHLVDTVLYFEGSGDSPLRLLKGIKNRFGATDEIGCFEHAEDGLKEVKDPSGFFLSEHDAETVGYATSIIVEGNRALPIEVQALVSETRLPNPRRVTHGVDNARVLMIQAILEKYTNMRLDNKDVYVSTTGGLISKDTSIDLAIAAAIISSYYEEPVPEYSVFLGETTLTGEIRPARETHKRCMEAVRLGFSNIISPVIKREDSTPYSVRNVRFMRDVVEKINTQ